MAKRIRDKESGQIFWQLQDGTIIPQSELIDDSDIDELDTFLINAGATFASIGRTARSAFEDRSALGAEQRQEQEDLAGINARNPISAIAGSLAPTLATLPLSGGVAAMTRLGVAEGLAQFREDPTEQLLAGLTGGLLGGGGARVAEKIQAAGSAARETARQARGKGLPVTVGERTGSKIIRSVETGLDLLPFGRSSVVAQRQGQLNQAANRAMGVSGDKVTGESFEQASKQTSEIFREVAKNTNNVEMGEEFGEAFRTISSKFSKAAKLKKQEGLADGGGGILQGNDFMDVRKTLADYGYSQQGKGNPLSDVALQMVEQMDDALEQQSGVVLRQAYGKAREQFRMMKILQRGKTVNSAKDVSAARLETGLRQNLDQSFFRPADATLKNPESVQLMDLTKTLTEPLLNPTVGNSGTAERLLGGIGVSGFLGSLATGNLGIAGLIGAGAGLGGVTNAALGSQAVGAAAEGAGRFLAPRIGGAGRAVNDALLDQILQANDR